MATSTKPRVLHICKVFLPVKGGIQNVVYSLTSLLRNYSHTVITTGEDGSISSETMNQAQVLRCRSYGQIASMPIAPSLISRVLRVSRPQLIVVHYPFPLAELALAFRWFAPPIVVHWHSEVIAQRKLKWLVAPLTLLVLVRAKRIVVTSEKMLEASTYLKIFKRKVVTISYGIQPVASTSEVLPSTAYFALVGRHVSYKGIDIAIRSLKYTPAKLVIAGDGPLFEKHKKLARDLGVADRIVFEAHASDAQVVKLIQNSIALLVPSVRENEAFALVQLEAMRLGKPVINTRLRSSVPWVARDQREALTVTPSKADQLAAAMTRLATEPKLARELGEAGLLRFHKRFKADHFAEKMEKLYDGLIAERQ